MTTPLWVLLGFAAWTLLVLSFGIGLERWSTILRGRAKLHHFQADVPHGSERYRRAMRAHANCLENLPVYGAVVLAATAAGVDAPLLDALALVLLGARVVQSLVHVIPTPTNRVIGVRFTFFVIQVVCMVWMGAYVALAAA